MLGQVPFLTIILRLTLYNSLTSFFILKCFPVMQKNFQMVLLSVLLIVNYSCKNDTTVDPSFAKAEKTNLTAFDQEKEESGVIYEVNIRQYSPQGTFDAFTKDLPVLKDLGVKILWVMPIFPISEKNRKGQLGSYYAVSDFRNVNPEFGTLEDVDEMIAEAHRNDIAIILDWVPNHTGWDHTWIKEHPEWYTKDVNGNIVDPVNPDTGESFGWTDVADLNYDNMEMRAQMIKDLQYWVREHDVDGYRMDVAHKVPVDFFKTAIDSLEKMKPVFMLAEAEQHDLMANGFDMHYAWEMHHLFNEMARGEKNVTDFWTQLSRYDQTLGEDDINMYFITNHDENSWAGSLKERMPDNKELFTALTYMLPGMPLVYSGQEYDLDKRLAFFEKDSIPKSKGNYFDLLKRLGELKNNEIALNGGKENAVLIKIDQENPNILSFAREKKGEQLFFYGNFSDLNTKVSLQHEGTFVNQLGEVGKKYNGMDAIDLPAWQFVILKPESTIDFDLPVVPGTEK